MCARLFMKSIHLGITALLENAIFTHFFSILTASHTTPTMQA